MTNYKVSDLPRVNTGEQDMSFAVAAGGMSKQLTIDDLIERVKKSVEPGDVLVKCRHCGQWAAVMTACVHCGAPVDK